MTLSISAFKDAATYLTHTLKGVPFTNRGMVVDMDPGEQILFFIILMFIIYLTMWFGSYVYNNSVTKLSPDLSKISTYDFLGLYIVIHILFC